MRYTILDGVMAGAAIGALIFVAAVLLSGCATQRQLADEDRQSCLEYGFRPGTDAFAGCLMKENQTRYLGSQTFKAGVAASLR